jgi:hypothetical protein
MRYCPHSGTVQINLSFPWDAFELLQRVAPGKRAYGRFLGQLVKDYADEHGKVSETEVLLQRLKMLLPDK